MSTLRENVGDVLKASIVEARRKDYDRGWDECMEYFWSKREIEEKKVKKLLDNDS